MSQSHVQIYLPSFRIGHQNYNFSFGFWPVSGRTWPRDPLKRVGLEKRCINHPKLMSIYLHKNPLPIHYNPPLGGLFVRPLFGGQYENPRLRALFGGRVWCGVSLGFGAGLVWLLV